MHMRVYQEAGRAAVGDLLDRRCDFLAERCELAVHLEDAVRPRENSDGPPLTIERIEIVRDSVGLDLDFAEVGLRALRLKTGGNRRRRPGRQYQARESDGRLFHRSMLLPGK